MLARLVLTRFRWLFTAGDARDAEILALCHQVMVLQRQITSRRFNDTDRTVLALLASPMDTARRGRSLLILRPETVTSTDDSSLAAGPNHLHASQVDRRSIPSCNVSSPGWPGRTRRGATGGSTAPKPHRTR